MSSASRNLLQSLRVAIVGWGTAGQASALALLRTGVSNMTIFEKFPKAATVGAGMLLQPSGQLMLQYLGLLQETERYGARIDRLYGTAAYGAASKSPRTILDLRYGDHVDFEDKISYGVGIHRTTLYNVLHTAFEARTSNAQHMITRHNGTEIVGRRHHDSVTSVLQDAAGREHGPFDLVLICDGSNSRLRPASAEAHVNPWGAFWTVLKDIDRPSFNGAGDAKGGWTRRAELRQVYDGCEVMIGVLPVGQCFDPDVTASSDRDSLVSLFWSVRCDEMDHWQQQPLAKWKNEVFRRFPMAAPLLDQITDFSQLAKARYRDVKMKRWHEGHTLWLGDAAHGTSPQLGQGANMALVDGVTLAHCLSEAADRTGNAADAVTAALLAYEAARKDHLWYFQLASRCLTPVFQSSSKVIGTLRDVLMGPMGRVPLVRREMIDTLVGMRAGVIGRWKPPKPLP